jgi:hypothetical protein
MVGGWKADLKVGLYLRQGVRRVASNGVSTSRVGIGVYQRPVCVGGSDASGEADLQLGVRINCRGRRVRPRAVPVVEAEAAQPLRRECRDHPRSHR